MFFPHSRFSFLYSLIKSIQGRFLLFSLMIVGLASCAGGLSSEDNNSTKVVESSVTGVTIGNTTTTMVTQGDSDSLAVSAGGGLTPIYSWTGGNAFQVRVFNRDQKDLLVWSATTPGIDGITSPLIHGISPAGGVQDVGVEQILTIGSRYLVTVTRVSGQSGAIEFIP